MEIVFTRYNKFVFNKYNHKQKDEYILNIDKIIKSKIDNDVSVMNTYQAFILNYEITKLLSKVIGQDNKKYSRIIYVNQKISLTAILNLVLMLKKKYPDIDFTYSMYYDADDELLAEAVKGNIPIDIKKV